MAKPTLDEMPRNLTVKDLAVLYIAQEMKWSTEAIEYEKILVCGNLQGFAAYVDNYITAEIARLREALETLNAAIDSYWNAPRGMRLTGMAEVFVKEITAAQENARKTIATTKEGE